MKKALLVIDLQNDFLSPKRRFAIKQNELDRAFTNAPQIIKEAQSKGYELVYIVHEFASPFDRLLSNIFMGGIGKHGTEGVQIHPSIPVLSQNIFVKSKGDAFSNPKLKEFLKEKEVTDLYLIGLDGCQCVNATAQGALRNSFTTHLLTQAIISVMPKQAEKLLKKLETQGAKIIEKLD